MRLPYIILTIVLLFNIFIDIYVYMAMHTYLRRRIWSRIQAWSAVVFQLMFVAVLVMPVRSGGNTMITWTMWMIFIYISVYLSKILFVIFDILSRLPMLFKRSRWKWMTGVGTAIALLVFVNLWWGALVTRLSLDTQRVTVTDATLPKGLDGFTIAQISDMHLGTYNGDTAFVSRMVDRVNSLHPDIIVFTGDLVNRNSDEADAFVKPLSRLKARYGVYSILGNHDYGDYEDWPDDKARNANLEKLCTLERRMGWNLLRDRSQFIPVKSDTLVLIGVENISRPPFHTYGSLERAYPTLSDNRYKVLLSHDPTHWNESIHNNDTTHVALTLSGHTHAMQARIFGVSPAAWGHERWGGLYDDDKGHKLYVNIGLGTVGYPARIGATPEITLITLRRK